MATKPITRTILGSQMMSQILIGKEHVLIPNTTLNERFNINADAAGWLGRPSLACLVIGRGGHRNVTGGDGYPYTTPIQHRCSDFGLFDHIPWAMRNIAAGEDVSGGSFVKSNYCLRVVETISIAGVPTQFAVYYGRRIDAGLNTVMVGINHQVIEDGEITSTEAFTPDSSNLYPEPPEPPNNEVTITSADYLNVSAIIPLTISADEIIELRNVANLKWGDPDRAIISEVGVCMGQMKTVAGFTDVIGCQIFSHIVTYQQASATSQGFDINIEAGATEPLLALTN